MTSNGHPSPLPWCECWPRATAIRVLYHLGLKGAAFALLRSNEAIRIRPGYAGPILAKMTSTTTL